MGNPCGLCGSPHLSPLLNLGSQPLAEAYGRESPRYPLRLVRCHSCTLVQLGESPDQRTLFPPDHPYAVGDTAANREHFLELARVATRVLGSGDMITDIGANDGTFLSLLDQGFVKVAVEPTRQAGKIDDAHVYPYFFTAGVAQHIRDDHGRASVVTACNVLAHVPDPHDFMSGVMILLEDDGVFITENHDLRSVTEGLQIDTVYHEHLRYWDVSTLSRLLAMHGLAVTGCEPIPRHGGSFRVTARRVMYGDLQVRAGYATLKLHELLGTLTRGGDEVFGVSAATRATPLLHYAAIGRFLTCVCEVEGSAKIGLTMPGTDIPIVPDSVLAAKQPAYALLFCWHIRDTVIPRLRDAGYRGRFIVPLPHPEVISD